MDFMADIVADTKRYLAEAQKMLVAIQGGAKLKPGANREEAIQVLRENIAHYESVLRRYGSRSDA